MNGLKMDDSKYHPMFDRPRYLTKIPKDCPTFEELSKQMRINIDILKKEITAHVDRELERLRKG